MNTTITVISTIALLLVVTSSVSSAYAEVPGWVKTMPDGGLMELSLNLNLFRV